MRTVLEDITEQQQRIAEMEKYLEAGVAQARVAGHSWAEIGAALGMSRQAAHQRFSTR